MIVKLSFRLFIVRLVHDVVLNLLNSLNFCGFFKLRCSFVNKMADETRSADRSNTETYGPARDASQPMKTRNFTGSSLCLIIIIYNEYNYCYTIIVTFFWAAYGIIFWSHFLLFFYLLVKAVWIKLYEERSWPSHRFFPWLTPICLLITKNLLFNFDLI